MQEERAAALRRLAERQLLVDEAKAALAEFGDRAAPLNGLADYIIARKN